MKSLQLKQLEAKERSEFYQSLSLIQKFALIEGRPGSSRKETIKLRKQTNETSE